MEIKWILVLPFILFAFALCVPRSARLRIVGISAMLVIVFVLFPIRNWPYPTVSEWIIAKYDLYYLVNATYTSGYSHHGFEGITVGMSENEVRTLLGNPIDPMYEDTWGYSWPMAKRIGVIVAIHFDREGRVASKVRYVELD